MGVEPVRLELDWKGDLRFEGTKARLPLASLRARLVGERAPEDPKRLTRIDLHFRLEGRVPADRVERALALSREKYCSVWHSLRPDIVFNTSFEVEA